MPHTTRKHIDIDPRQERLLKRKAAELSTTESQLIREGIDMLLTRGTTISRDIGAWDAEKKYIQSHIKKGPIKSGRNW